MGSKIMNLWVSPDFESKKRFQVAMLGFVWSGMGRALMQFMQFFVFFALPPQAHFRLELHCLLRHIRVQVHSLLRGASA